MRKVCSDKIEYLDDLLNGFLGKEEEAILLKHLDNCENCSKYYSEMYAVKKALGTLKISAPADIVPNIMKAVVNEEHKPSVNNRRWMKPAFIASYATAACIVVALAVFFVNGGFLNKGMLESSELSDNEQQIKSTEYEGNPERDNSIMATDEAFLESGSIAAPEPAPESDRSASDFKEPGLTAVILDDEEFSFYTSAFAGEYSLHYNIDGENLAKVYGFTDSQDILYATANYTVNEIIDILLSEFGIKTNEYGENYVVAAIPAAVIANIEKRLDLAAAELVDEDLLSYTVRIIILN